MQTIALIDYGAGNLRSVERALARAGAEPVVTAAPDAIAAADRIVLPGQGAFAACMTGLSAQPGLIEALRRAVLERGAPFLGICVGMQLLADVGLEHGETQGLGWIGGACRVLSVGPKDILPHTGWNTAAPARAHPVLDALAPARHVYFNHSFVLDPPANTIGATTEHGETFACAVARDNLVGVQFHPEKSQAVGIDLLQRFVRWSP
ncbi:MAG: imidazole glycerol phosphate synthase subunit HisH [Alphaproteobacteria bacterium]|nr:imidazole glycerol phosphate synthase subunit HisH [Alphaproteobacteria bacterium]